MRKIFILLAFVLLTLQGHAGSSVGTTFQGKVKDGFFNIKLKLKIMSNDSIYWEMQDRWILRYAGTEYHFRAIAGTGTYDPDKKTVSFVVTLPRGYQPSYEEADTFFRSMRLTFSFEQHSSKLIGSFSTSVSCTINNVAISGSTGSANNILKKSS